MFVFLPVFRTVFPAVNIMTVVRQASSSGFIAVGVSGGLIIGGNLEFFP